MLKNDLVRYAEKTGLFDSYANLRRNITKSQVIILMYHRICPSDEKWKFDPLDPKVFEEQIKYLVENFEVIELAKLSKMISRGNIPKKAVSITFDDGYKDNYEFASPLLKKYGVPATIYLTTGLIDEKRLLWNEELSYVLFNTDRDSIDLGDLGFYKLEENRADSIFDIIEKLKELDNIEKESIMEKIIDLADVNIPQSLANQNILSWNEIKKMNGRGIDFGAHTVNHPILSNISIEKAEWEILESKNRIEDILGIKVDSFAYPNGDYNDNILSVVKNAGFNSSVLVEPGFVTDSSDLFRLKRINGTTPDLHVLKLSLCGLWKLRNL